MISIRSSVRFQAIPNRTIPNFYRPVGMLIPTDDRQGGRTSLTVTCAKTAVPTTVLAHLRKCVIHTQMNIIYVVRRNATSYKWKRAHFEPPATVAIEPAT